MMKNMYPPPFSLCMRLQHMRPYRRGSRQIVQHAAGGLAHGLSCRAEEDYRPARRHTARRRQQRERERERERLVNQSPERILRRLARQTNTLLEIIIDLPFGFPINNIISLCVDSVVGCSSCFWLDYSIWSQSFPRKMANFLEMSSRNFVI